MTALLPVLPRSLSTLDIPCSDIKPWNDDGLELEFEEPIHVAAMGDVHGEFDLAAQGIEDWNERHPHRTLDFGLQVGDLEAIRDSEDLATVPGPPQYRKMGSFQRFSHEGPDLFPLDTIAIHGNHEPFRHIAEVRSGGQLTHNIRYGGRFFTTQRHGLKISGIGGIHNHHSFDRTTPPVVPDTNGPNANNWRHWGHLTEPELRAAMALFEGSHVLMIHDWIEGLVDLLDPYTIRGQVNPRAREAGNEHLRKLIEHVKPDVLICGHMHQHLSGQIFWDTGEVTEVICLDTYDGKDAVDRRTMAVLELSNDGVRVAHRFMPKVQTPELKALQDTMTDDDKRFEFRLTTPLDKDAVKAKISERLRGIEWRGDSFIYGGMEFTLTENNLFDRQLQLDEFEGDIFAPYILRAIPHEDPSKMHSKRVIGMTNQIKQALAEEELNPVVSASFQDLTY